MFANRTAHQARAAQDSAAGAVAMIELAEAFIGQEGLQQLVAGLSLTDGTQVVSELIDACNAVYGQDTGESSASSTS